MVVREAAVRHGCPNKLVLRSKSPIEELDSNTEALYLEIGIIGSEIACSILVDRILHGHLFSGALEAKRHQQACLSSLK